MVLWIAVGLVPVGAAAPAASDGPSLSEGPGPTTPLNDSTTGTSTGTTSDGANADDTISDESSNWSPGLGPAKTKLDRARALAATFESVSEVQAGTHRRASQLAQVGVKLQIAQQDANSQLADPTDVTLPDISTPAHSSPSAAIFALLDRQDYTPTAEEVADIRAMDDLAEPTRTELTDVINAYLAYERATERAFTESPEAVDLRRVRVAQLQLVEESEDLRAALEDPDAPGLAVPASHGTVANVSVQVSPYVSINLSTHDDKYSNNYALQIDAIGDDTYNNNAGGASGSLTSPGAAALIDLNGTDTYNGRNGGGYLYSAGFLLDMGIRGDTYDAGARGRNGGALYLSAGFLMDTGGDDDYLAGDDATNGGAVNLAARGFLLDANGSDTYEAGSGGTNGGGVAGGFNIGPGVGRAHGFLLDVGLGDDTFTAGTRGTNGGTDAALGSLINLGDGSDIYEGGRQGSNGGGVIVHGGTGAQGLLLDSVGSDSYNVTASNQSIVGVNGGAGADTRGALVDLNGPDTYNVTLVVGDTNTAGIKGANGGAVDNGHGLLVDGGSVNAGPLQQDDTYDVLAKTINSSATANIDGVNGGVVTSSSSNPAYGNLTNGTLVDMNGTDTYRVKTKGPGSMTMQGTNGEAVGAGAGLGQIDPNLKGFNVVGFLLDGGGDGDKYIDDYCPNNQNPDDDTIHPKGDRGAQIDSNEKPNVTSNNPCG